MKTKTFPIIPIALLVLFCLWFFLFVKGDGTISAQWLGFGFGVVACLIPIIPWMMRDREYVGSATLWSISYAFVAIELLASIIVMVVAPDDWKIPLFILLIILIAYAVVFVASKRANIATDAAQAATQANRVMQQNWAAQVRPLMTNRSLSQAARKKVERAYDALRSTPVKSSLETSDIDNQISFEIESLLIAARESNEEQIDDCSRRIASLVQERRIVLSGLNR